MLLGARQPGLDGQLDLAYCQFGAVAEGGAKAEVGDVCDPAGVLGRPEAAAASAMSQSSERGSRRKHHLPCRFELALQVGIGDRTGLDQVDGSAEQVGEGVLETEELLEGGEVGVGVEGDEEIDVAVLWVEVLLACRRVYDLEPADAVAAGGCCYGRAFGVDDCVHRGGFL